MIQDEYSCSIRALQHYMYCPHRWGLIYNDCSWAENYFVTKANLMHRRVHDPDRAYVSRKKKVLTSVTVFNDELNLYGVTDCIEMGRKPTDADSSPQLTIVEYKPRKPNNAEYNQDDLMQVFAQKVCVDWTMHSKTEGVLYYADVRQRVHLPLNEHYNAYYEVLVTLLNEIRSYIKNGAIPPIRKRQKCRGCSFIDLCLPRANQKTQKTVFQQLEEMYSCENC